MPWRRTSPPVVPYYLQEPLDIDVFLVYVSQVVTVHIDVLLNLLSVLLEQFFVRAFEVFVVINWDLFNLLACHNTQLDELVLFDEEFICDFVVALVEDA